MDSLGMCICKSDIHKGEAMIEIISGVLLGFSILLNVHLAYRQGQIDERERPISFCMMCGKEVTPVRKCICASRDKSGNIITSKKVYESRNIKPLVVTENTDAEIQP
jgi:hypothetical protein